MRACRRAVSARASFGLQLLRERAGDHGRRLSATARRPRAREGPSSPTGPPVDGAPTTGGGRGPSSKSAAATASVVFQRASIPHAGAIRPSPAGSASGASAATSTTSRRRRSGSRRRGASPTTPRGGRSFPALAQPRCTRTGPNLVLSRVDRRPGTWPASPSPHGWRVVGAAQTD